MPMDALPHRRISSIPVMSRISVSTMGRDRWRASKYPWGLREIHLIDPSGILWHIAQELAAS